jgi:phosphatidylglycerol---prolipoprotein diacylglyceryl transferase
MSAAVKAFVWDFDPIIVDLGLLQLRWYGVVFALTLLIAILLWRWQMRRGGYPSRLAESFVTWGVLATVIGARLGHCFFYHPGHFLTHPLEVLYVWKGGLASHGATVGLGLTLIVWARRNKLRIIEILDRFAFSAAVGAAGIRLGNFLNSEIVGRPTEVAWAVRFVRFDDIPRHPSQFYEFALGIFVFLCVYLADRRAGREKRPLGLLSAVFLCLYFAGRFAVEFVKERHSLQGTALSMGQILSILPFTLGVVAAVWSVRKAEPTNARRLAAEAEEARTRGRAGGEGEPGGHARRRKRRQR